MTQEEKIKEKIAKLIRKAKSTNSTEEGASFMMMANKLLMKYNLEMDEIKVEEDKNDIEHEIFDLTELHRWNKSSGDWMAHIYNMTASMNLCMIVRTKNYEFDSNNKKKHFCKITLIGNEINKEITKYMATTMIQQLKTLSVDAWKEYQRGYGTEKINAWKRAYFRGAVSTLYKIFKDHKENQYKEVGENLTALIRTNEVELRDYTQQIIGRVGKVKSARLSAQGGKEMGERDGHKVKVRKGLSQSQSNINHRLLT